MRRGSAEFFGVLAVGLLIACLVLGLYVWYERHPCVRYETRPGTCGGDCALLVPAQIGQTITPVCVKWNDTYPCTVDVCVERKGGR
jgi:hypothetical protein